MARTVIDILEDLENTSGSLAKRDILEAARKNELLKNIFVAAQDPYTVYYVTKFKMPVAVETGGDDDTVMQAFLNLLPKLSSRELTGNAAKNAVSAFFAELDGRQQKWCQRILIHNLRCGVQTTVNKVWPGTIQSFEVALAQTLKSEFVAGEGIKILERVTYPVRVEPKLDGLRCIAVKKDGVVTFYTRNGTVLETLPKIKKALEEAAYDDMVLDGEAMGADWNESSSVMMSSKTKKDDSNMFFNVFDTVTAKEWFSKEGLLSYAQRTEFVTKIVALVDQPCVRAVPHIMAQDEKELKDYFAKCMDEGYEGVMLKTLDSTYEWDRSKNILKLKPCVTYEGAVVGWYEGRAGTKNEGKFGGFRVLLPNGIITRVGGGYNDAMRAKIQLEGIETWKGKIVECEAQPDPLTKDGLTVDGKMRFPVFIRERAAADVDPKVIEAYEAYKPE